ncbi:MurR/RpiR family transcriptional regulator [Mycetocola lacteus]|uniref:MurR/RpiR family transcriptional regulator n=1 Tax=Mycetocola lacteus TaxID=76637 RepID=UPI001FE539E6|nr:MurR/RpiR family transcriptional regulator [Mycetocola lacteus]
MTSSSIDVVSTGEIPTAMPTVRIATALPGMQRSERRAAEIIAADPESVVELTAQELADRAGVARSTVVRMCQSLGYRGYPQLRVALAGELALAGEIAQRTEDADPGAGALGRIRAEIVALAQVLPQIASVLSEPEVDSAVDSIVAAGRILVVASGLSGPLAMDLAMRLTAAGRPAETLADPIGQQIAARGLRAEDVCLVISGSGANEASLRAAAQANEAGARVIAVTSFRNTPLTRLAAITLLLAPAASFRQELEHTSRVPHVVFLEALVETIGTRLGAAGERARSRVLDVLAENLGDEAGR